MVIAGRHARRARRTAAAIGHGVRGRDVDVTVPDSIGQALTGVVVAVNCVDQPEHGLLWAAIERGLGYADITPHLNDLGRGDGYTQVRGAAQTGVRPGQSATPEQILAERIARGEIDEDDYRRRLAVLRGAPPA